jgi:hypothetical protein
MVRKERSLWAQSVASDWRTMSISIRMNYLPGTRHENTGFHAICLVIRMRDTIGSPEKTLQPFFAWTSAEGQGEHGTPEK